jgi:hypothetical protein
VKSENERQASRRARFEFPKRIVGVEYAGKLEAVVFKFEDGRILGVPLQELEGVDKTPVIRVFLEGDGDAAVIEQFSGNRLEVPWDVILCYADPALRTAGLPHARCASGPR